jgi:hypothetical protein
MNKKRVIIAVMLFLVLGTTFLYWILSGIFRFEELRKPKGTYFGLTYAANLCEGFSKDEYDEVACSTNMHARFHDCWDRKFIFSPFDEKLGYGRLISYGKDGKPGGSGDNRDLEVRFPMGDPANEKWNEDFAHTVSYPKYRFFCFFPYLPDKSDDNQ